MPVSRRSLLLAAFVPPAQGKLVDTHIHLFDPKQFPYHPAGTYQPKPETLEDYAKEIGKIGLDHAIVVHPEPYQDDHRYLEYCFQNEPRKGFFKGTVLFDATDPATPGRLKEMTKRWPDKIVALRVHSVRSKINPSGAIHNRDLTHPQMARTWAVATKLGLAIQMHMIPMWAPQVGALLAKTPGATVIIDHLARYSQGTPAEYEEVLKLGRKGRVFMKFSGLGYSSREKAPHRDLTPLAKRLLDAFGPDRIIWGGLGMTKKKHEEQRASFEAIWSFTDDATRAKIRGGNAMGLYRLG
jgi:L-fuconolactonase